MRAPSRPRLLLLATVTLLLLTAAQPALAIRPRDVLIPPVPPVEVLRGDPVVSAHVVRRGDAIQACAATGRAPRVELRAKIRWDRHGRAREIVVRGGSAELRRCVKAALRGRLPIVRRRAGSGRVAFVVNRPISPDPLAIRPEL